MIKDNDRITGYDVWFDDRGGGLEGYAWITERRASGKKVKVFPSWSPRPGQNHVEFKRDAAIVWARQSNATLTLVDGGHLSNVINEKRRLFPAK